MKRIHFLLFIMFFVIVSSSLVAYEDVRVLHVGTYIFNDNIIFSVKVENKRDENIYIVLDYKLEKIEYRERENIVFAVVSGKPRLLEYEGYFITDSKMPNINIVGPGQKQLFHIIIKNYKHNIPKGVTFFYTVLEGMNYFILEPPGYDACGSIVGYYTYKLYSDFYRKNVRLLDRRLYIYEKQE